MPLQLLTYFINRDFDSSRFGFDKKRQLVSEFVIISIFRAPRGHLPQFMIESREQLLLVAELQIRSLRQVAPRFAASVAVVRPVQLSMTQVGRSFYCGRMDVAASGGILVRLICQKPNER